MLSAEDDAIVVAFRLNTFLQPTIACTPLQATLRHLTRSSLHRCLRRHGIWRASDPDAAQIARKRFMAHPIDYFYIDIAEVRTEQGKLYLLVATGRTSKSAVSELQEKVTRRTAADFLRAIIKAAPSCIHIVLTDSGTHFTTPGDICSAAAEIKRSHSSSRAHAGASFRICRRRGDTDHRLTKRRHSWTNGQVERLNRTPKEATIKQYYNENA